MQVYDVAIAGGGPAGSWLARELSRRNRRVILFERSTRLGEPNFSSAVSPLSVVDNFGLDRDCVAAAWDTGELYGPRSAVIWKFREPVGAVLDFRKLKSSLISEARECGAQILLATAVKSVHSGRAASCVVTENGRQTHARIVVDASGPAAVLATQLGLRKGISNNKSAGVELICRVSPLSEQQRRSVAFYFGSSYAPHGYAWIFPMGGTEVKIGVCVYQLGRYKHLNIGSLLNQFVSSIPWLRNRKVIERHAGVGYLQGGIEEHVKGNVLAIGDAADQVNPLAGEGIRHALQSARFASVVIERALAAGVAELQAYNALWKGYAGLRWKTCAGIARLMYTHFSDRMYDLLIKRLGKITPEEAFRVAFEYAATPVLQSFCRRRDRALVNSVSSSEPAAPAVPSIDAGGMRCCEYGEFRESP